MDSYLLPLGVWAQLMVGDLRTRVVEAWRHRDDEAGVDEAVTKMIWLAVGIGVAVVATAFFINIFNTAKSSVPDPTPPTP
jgi:hypothetical protein